MDDLLRSFTLMLTLLNPFLVVVYLLDVLEKRSFQSFTGVLLRGAAISVAVFWSFAILGDAMFADVLQARFASFQIFGGVVFLLIGLQFVFRGPTAIELLRGDAEGLAGAIAMPVLIGPGTISASVLVGERHEPLTACLAILAAVAVSMVVILVLKAVYDAVRPRREPLVQRYIEIAGRITALYVGTVSVEMIMKGISSWAEVF